MNELEIEIICENLERSLDSHFHKAFQFKTGFILELYKKNNSNFLIIDLNPQAPFIWYVERKNPVALMKEKKPVTLFLNAHAKGKRLIQILHKKDLGRIIEIVFGYEDPVKLEIRLFPHGQNIIVSSFEKKISVFPIKEVAPSLESKTSLERRTLYALSLEWQKSLESPGREKNDKESLLQKKRTAIQKVENALNLLIDQNWEGAGEWIKENQSLNVPLQFKSYIDRSKSFSQNLDLIFKKAKALKLKIEGTRERLGILQSEYRNLEFQEDIKLPEKQQLRPSKEGRGFEVGSECRLLIGRNAQENLKILRESQSWDYWMHLKDYPGAHGILKCPRNYNIKIEELEIAAQRIAERSKKSHHQIKEGDSFEILVTQKRFVKPIKGDSLGRVRYSDEKIYTFKKRNI